MSEATEAEEQIAVLPFAAWLQDLRAGRAHAEITDGLHELIAAVTEQRKPGKMTIELEVKPVAGVEVQVTDSVKIKLPEPAKPVSLYFVDRAHNLTREDPDRPTLDLREVPKPEPADLKDVTTA